MHPHFKYLGLIAVIAGIVIEVSCKSAPLPPPPPLQSAPNFEDAQDKDWKLVTVRTKSGDISFDRDRLIAEGFGDIFTIRFGADQFSGTGAPNRCFGPYGIEKDQAIWIDTTPATSREPVRNPEKLREHDFFTYLQNAFRWAINGGNLELSTKEEDGAEAVMVFTNIF
ncbi:MAG: META domain-containing protein [Treponema sp.]|nr:META domain-containing protein [Treponema sp.]